MPLIFLWREAMYDTILFLDFDGTITSEETLEGSMRLAIDPAIYEGKNRELIEGKFTLAEVLQMGFSTIPSYKYDAIMDYVRKVPIRKGFRDLILAMEELGIPVVVISGGLKPYVMEKLGPFQDRLLGIHSVDLDYSGDFMRLLPEYEEDGELMQKTLVMDQYDYKRAICVGDSMTDVGMAKACQLVFARDLLAKLLDKDGVAYVPWNNFHDIKDYILKWAQS